MPIESMSKLSDAARVWIFASDQPVGGADADQMLGRVDEFLNRWHAHGTPLVSAREWRDDRFLLIAVDGEHASGCSIDGLFRTLKDVGGQIGANLVTSGLVFFRDAGGRVQSANRAQFAKAAAAGEIGADTRVFDTSLTSLGDVRERFEQPASASWHAALLPANR
jgi:hypothetical protein